MNHLNQDGFVGLEQIAARPMCPTPNQEKVPKQLKPGFHHSGHQLREKCSPDRAADAKIRKAQISGVLLLGTIPHVFDFHAL